MYTYDTLLTQDARTHTHQPTHADLNNIQTRIAILVTLHAYEHTIILN